MDPKQFNQFDTPMYDPPPVQYQPPVQQQPVSSTQHNTTVVIQQPAPAQQQGPRAWSSELCACFNDMTSCCLVTFFPLCYEMHLWNRADESPCGPCCIFNSALVLRTKIRTQHNIHGSIMNDCFTTGCCCYPCVLCQMSRELDFIERTSHGPGGAAAMTTSIQ